MIVQKYHRGDHVKIADNYSSGSRIDSEAWHAVPSEFAGKEAIVKESSSSSKSYTLFIKGQGNVAWFPEDALTLIQEKPPGLLERWEQEEDEQIKIESDLDWIFSHGKEIIDKPRGASISALAKCFGVNNLWGPSGEGFVYHQNAMMTLALATPFLVKGDKSGWLEFCDTRNNKGAA